MHYTFPITRNENPKPKPDPKDIGFSKYFTDHMFFMNYEEGKGWHDGRIIPYGPLSLDPAATTLHYAQEAFEGMKAYRTPDGKVNLFRPDMNARRMIKTCERMCIPEIEEDLFVSAVEELVKIDADWIPDLPGTSLYIRPFIISPEMNLAPVAAKSYWFIIILTPVTPYHSDASGSLHGSHILVEDEYIRAAVGGTGFAKCGGNYAGALRANVKAEQYHCNDVLWLDAKEHHYIEEVGTSNAFFVIDGKVITSPLTGSILPGVTRDSVIQLLEKWGVEVDQRRLPIDEAIEAAKDGRMTEAWASGTACVISPIGLLNYKGQDYPINGEKVGDLSNKLYNTLYGMQTGILPDDMGWVITL
ncbi:MAG: branched-chain amino acid aminotransferase [Anaerolineaceae bacterium]|nr:branched-chain amino acid aminotransferase [Anaerolineaceae bacterium]